MMGSRKAPMLAKLARTMNTESKTFLIDFDDQIAHLHLAPYGGM